MHVFILAVLFIIAATVFTVNKMLEAYQLDEVEIEVSTVVITWLFWIPLVCVEFGMWVYWTYIDKDDW